MRRIVPVFLAVLMTCSPAAPEALASTFPPPALTPLSMMDSTVQIHVDIKATMISGDEDEDAGVSRSQETQIEDGWVGSGVVYDKTDGRLSGVRSRILSANHVLETPAVGSVEDIVINFLGIEIPLGKRRIDSVKITMSNSSGRVCSVKVLKLGDRETGDVATAEADCDAGRVARIGGAVPVAGEKVFVVGHPEGVPLAMVTEGYVAGWMDGYLLTSAPAWGGNSGGPVFYNGEVIGLLVRGSREYPHITLTVPLESVLRRIAETPPL
jgi:S1-C subfamily serine protease